MRCSSQEVCVTSAANIWLFLCWFLISLNQFYDWNQNEHVIHVFESLSWLFSVRPVPGCRYFMCSESLK